MIFSRIVKSAMVALAFSFSFLSVCQAQDTTPSLRQQLGQKLILDIRFYCDTLPDNSQCREPVTRLPDELATMLINENIGGVILFAENLVSAPQVVALNHSLQALAQQHGKPPFIIAVDQEGGRVARLADDIATRFVGNMAIGATYEKHGVTYANKVATGMAQALKTLGFNTNFAPSLDINNNPKNPVINVRSFSDSPKRVAELGEAMTESMQSQGIVSAIKHFPGHGDTSVDSHTGLPQVLHPKRHIFQNEVLPFAALIASQTPPEMVMTAHIQYPALDNTVIKDRQGIEQVLPATLSRRILQDMLRQQLNYQGIIVTDALDMAGIAHYFAQDDAVVQTFNAGADIALMPYTIRSKQDITGFSRFLDSVAAKLTRTNTQEWRSSLARIASLKQRYNMAAFASEPVDKRKAIATQMLPAPHNKQLEQALANDAMTVVKGKPHLPLDSQGQWWVLMPDEARCRAFILGIEAQNQDSGHIQCTSMAKVASWPDISSMEGVKHIIIGDISPLHSAVEMGGMDDLAGLRRSNLKQQHHYFKQVLAHFSSNAVTKTMVALRTPYVLKDFESLVDLSLATYSYNVNNGQSGKIEGPSFHALARVLLGKMPAQGQLPVSLN